MHKALSFQEIRTAHRLYLGQWCEIGRLLSYKVSLAESRDRWREKS